MAERCFRAFCCRGVSIWSPARPAVAIPSGGLACFVACCPLPLACFPAPYPPLPPFPTGRGSLKVYFAGGFAPGTPALNRLRHLQNLPLLCPAGACPAGHPPDSAAAVPGGGLTFFVASLPRPQLAFLPPIPPTPFPGGEGGAPKFISPGASPPAPPALNRLRHLQNLPLLCPTGGLACFAACLTLPPLFPAGGLPALPPPYPAISFTFCPPIPPTPFPGGEGGDQKFISPGASPPAPLH